MLQLFEGFELQYEQERVGKEKKKTSKMPMKFQRAVKAIQSA